MVYTSYFWRMKIIAIGDVHGRNFWKAIAHEQAYDKLVIIGDYFDSLTISAAEQLYNFMEIIAFKKANPEKVTLLIGNHDFHYLPAAMEMNETYSGFQDRHAFRISYLFQENLHQFSMCYQWENYLFTHAGVTHTWLDNAGYDGEPVNVFINDLFKHQPLAFFFNGTDPYGDNVTQSPIWVRPDSLKKNAFKYETIRQVVGHTTHQEITIVKNRFFFIDTQGTSGEYLVIEDGKVRVGGGR